MRRVVPLVLGAALVCAADTAHACSCAIHNWSPSLAVCEDSRRVFAGTIAGYDWPLIHEYTSDGAVRIAVDAVWRGDVPDEVVTTTGMYCCTCGISPPPGTPVVVCDDAEGDAPTAFSSCAHPRFEPDPERFLDELGSGRPPAPSALRWSDVVDALSRHRLLGIPIATTLLAALAGRRGRQSSPVPSAARTLGRVALLGLALVTVRVVLRATTPDDWDRCVRVSFATLALATSVGIVLGHAHGGTRRGFVVACSAVALVLVAGLARLHLPIQPPGSVECSLERARAYLRTLPVMNDIAAEDDEDRKEFDARLAAHHEALAEAARRAPFACTDWWLSAMWVDPSGPCVLFNDGLGGTYRLCVSNDYVRYSAETPG